MVVEGTNAIIPRSARGQCFEPGSQVHAVKIGGSGKPVLRVLATCEGTLRFLWGSQVQFVLLVKMTEKASGA